MKTRGISYEWQMKTEKNGRSSRASSASVSKSIPKLTAKQIKRKRHYYASRLKEKFQVDNKVMTIVLPYSKISEVPVPERYDVRQLIKLGYNCQLSIF